jgi:cell shape-determining protein MreD
MNTHRETVLLPANRAFAAFSLACAFLLNLFPWGPLPLAPDFVALALVFWSLREPQMVGIGVAFALGLLMRSACTGGSPGSVRSAACFICCRFFCSRRSPP